MSSPGIHCQDKWTGRLQPGCSAWRVCGDFQRGFETCSERVIAMPFRQLRCSYHSFANPRQGCGRLKVKASGLSTIQREDRYHRLKNVSHTSALGGSGWDRLGLMDRMRALLSRSSLAISSREALRWTFGSSLEPEYTSLSSCATSFPVKLSLGDTHAANTAPTAIANVMAGQGARKTPAVPKQSSGLTVVVGRSSFLRVGCG